MMKRPRRRTELLIRETGEGLFLYDPRTGVTFLLNGTAAAILELCDGRTSVPSIAEEILSVLPVCPETVHADVRRTIKELVEKGLVEEGE